MAEITFTRDERDIICRKIQLYMREELGQEVGQFDAGFLLDFFAEEIGASTRFTFQVQGLSAATSVARFEATEAISDLFEVDLLLTSEDKDIAFADVVGQAAVLKLETDKSEPRFLHGIVSKLSKAKLLRAMPGPKGGILLARDPESITILEIIEAVEGKINLMDCLEHPEHCSDSGQCSIMGVLHTAQAAMLLALRNSNLKLMVKARNDPFAKPEKHFLKPQFGCPVLK